MRRIGPLIAEARTTIEAQAAHIQKQALEYISLFDQCSDAQDRVKELEAKCALLSQSLEQEKTRSAALEAGLTDGVTDDMAVLQSRVEELEAQLRERGEPVARVEETPVGPKLYVNDVFVHSWFGCCYDDRVKAIAASINAAHPPAAAASEDTKRLDWLDKNMFHREMNEWDARIHAGETMWVTFAPKGIQGSARKIIDAGIAAQKEKG
jgi:hypothetical protein